MRGMRMDNIEPQAPEAHNEPVTPKTLAAAKAMLDEERAARAAELSSLNETHANALAALTEERDNLKAQFDALTTEATALKDAKLALETQLGEVSAKVSSLEGDMAAATERSAKDEENIARLEALCGVKGVSISSAAPAAPKADRPVLARADFDALSHDDRNAFMRSGGRIVD